MAKKLIQVKTKKETFSEKLKNAGSSFSGVSGDDSGRRLLQQMFRKETKDNNDASRLTKRTEKKTSASVEKAVERAVLNPQGSIAKTNKIILNKLTTVDRNVRFLRSDTQYLRRKLDKQSKALQKMIDEGSGGGSIGNFLKTATNAAIGGGGVAGLIGAKKAAPGLTKMLGLGSKIPIGPTSKATSTLLGKFTAGLAKMARMGGWIASIAYIISQAIEPMMAYLQGAPDVVVRREIIGAVAGVLGAILGAQVGGAAGAAAGAFVFGVGAIPAGAVGFILGGVLGYFSGEASEALAELIFDAVVQGRDVEKVLNDYYNRKYPKKNVPAPKQITLGQNKTKTQSTPTRFSARTTATYTPTQRAVPNTPSRFSARTNNTYIPNSYGQQNPKNNYTPADRQTVVNIPNISKQIARGQVASVNNTPKQNNRGVISMNQPIIQSSLYSGYQRDQQDQNSVNTQGPKPRNIRNNNKKKNPNKKMFRGISARDRENEEMRIAANAGQPRGEIDSFGNFNPTRQGVPKGRIFNGVDSAMGSYMYDQRWDQMPSMYGGRFANGGGGGGNGGGGGFRPGGSVSGAPGSMDSGGNGKSKQDLLTPQAKAMIADLSAGKTISNSSYLNQFSSEELEKFGIQKQTITSPENRSFSATSYNMKAVEPTAADIQKQIQQGGKNSSGLTKHQSAILAGISSGESGNIGYGAINYVAGGGKTENFDKHPFEGKKGYTAAGKYQILSSNYERYSKKLGITDFSPTSQDKIAYAMAKDVYKNVSGGDLDIDSKDPAKMRGIMKTLGHSSGWHALRGGGIDVGVKAAQDIISNSNINEFESSKSQNYAAAFSNAQYRLKQELTTNRQNSLGEYIAGKGGFSTGDQNAVSMGGYDNSRVIQNQKQVAGIRKGELQQHLVDKLNYVANKNDLYYEVFSGGQRMPGAEGHTGTHNHDGGNAADGKWYRLVDGKKEYLSATNPKHQEILSKVTKDSAAAGINVVGSNYMTSEGVLDPEKFHYGGPGNPRVYSESPGYLPEYVKDAFNAGQKELEGGFDYKKEVAAAIEKTKQQTPATRSVTPTTSTTDGQKPYTPKDVLGNPIVASATPSATSEQNLTPNNQQGQTNGAGAAGFMGGLWSNVPFLDTMKGFRNKTKEAGIPTTGTVTGGGYSSHQYTKMAEKLKSDWEAGGKKGDIVLTGHSAGGTGVVRVAEELKRLGVKKDVVLNIVDGMAYYDLTKKVPDNVKVVNDFRPANQNFGDYGDWVAADPNKTTINKINMAGGDHGSAAAQDEAQQIIGNSLRPATNRADSVTPTTEVPAAKIAENAEEKIVPVPTPRPTLATDQEPRLAGAGAGVEAESKGNGSSKPISPTVAAGTGVTAGQEPASTSQARYNQNNRNQHPAATKGPSGVSNGPAWHSQKF